MDTEPLTPWAAWRAHQFDPSGQLGRLVAYINQELAKAYSQDGVTISWLAVDNERMEQAAARFRQAAWDVSKLEQKGDMQTWLFKPSADAGGGQGRKLRESA